jgi:hypothetical protein
MPSNSREVDCLARAVQVIESEQDEHGQTDGLEKNTSL